MGTRSVEEEAPPGSLSTYLQTPRPPAPQTSAPPHGTVLEKLPSPNPERPPTQHLTPTTGDGTTGSENRAEWPERCRVRATETGREREETERKERGRALGRPRKWPRFLTAQVCSDPASSRSSLGWSSGFALNTCVSSSAASRLKVRHLRLLVPHLRPGHSSMPRTKWLLEETKSELWSRKR